MCVYDKLQDFEILIKSFILIPIKLILFCYLEIVNMLFSSQIFKEFQAVFMHLLISLKTLIELKD